jgi:predicted nuclease with TOPRIM domain
MKKQKELAHMLSVVNELNAQLTAQLAEKDAEVAHWKANHDNMAKKNALLSQRHDLPVDRIQAAKHFDDLSAEVERLREDAMRYRYLRDENNWGEDSGNDWGELAEAAPVEFDNMIDARMKLLSTTQQEEG